MYLGKNIVVVSLLNFFFHGHCDGQSLRTSILNTVVYKVSDVARMITLRAHLSPMLICAKSLGCDQERPNTEVTQEFYKAGITYVSLKNHIPYPLGHLEGHARLLGAHKALPLQCNDSTLISAC